MSGSCSRFSTETLTLAVVLHEPEKCVVHPLTADAKFTHGVTVGRLLAT